MSRNKARVVAMQALFQLDTGVEGLQRVVEDGIEQGKFTERDLAYINNIIQNVIDNQEPIDNIIKKFSIDWDIHRLGKVERAILRLSVGEMMYVSDVPVSVAINEAVRLAKRYGAEHASKFINGILGKFSREQFGEPERVEEDSLPSETCSGSGDT